MKLGIAGVLAGAFAALAAGCGYSVGSTLDEKYQTIFVDAFHNQSKEYDLQAPLTNALRRKFVADGRLHVTQRESADLLIEGVILEYRLKGLTYDLEDDVTQFLTLIAAGVRVTDTHTGEILWEDPQMTGETSFYTRSVGETSDRLRGNAETFLPSVRSFQTAEENRAAAEALEQLASDIFYRTVEPPEAVSVLDLLRALGTSEGFAPKPVYLFCPGKADARAKMATFEPFLAERAVERLTAALVDPSMKDFAFASFYADESDPGHIVSEAQTLPFLAERRVILVRNAERYHTESAAKAMLQYLDSPNESSVVMFITSKSDKRTKFHKACEKLDAIVECPAFSERELIPWVKAEAQPLGKTLRDAAARELIGRTGTHLSDVNNALALVVNFVGPDRSELTEEDIRAACADVAEEEVWALTDAIASSRGGEALAALRRLTDLGKHPDELIGTINWLLKSAYSVAASPGNAAISPFVAKKVGPLADKLGVSKLRDAFALCTDTQFFMRNTGTNSELALELLVVKLAAPLPRRKSA